MSIGLWETNSSENVFEIKYLDEMHLKFPFTNCRPFSPGLVEANGFVLFFVTTIDTEERFEWTNSISYPIIQSIFMSHEVYTWSILVYLDISFREHLWIFGT